MKKIPLLNLFILFSLTSCSSLKKEEEEEPEKDNSIVVGRVYSVAKKEKIVLIEKYQPGNLPPDGIYHTLGSTHNTASIKPTGEKMRNLFAADLLNGDPQIGDAVLMRMIVKADETSEDSSQSESPANPPENADSTPENAKTDESRPDST